MSSSMSENLEEAAIATYRANDWSFCVRESEEREYMHIKNEDYIHIYVCT